jgi:hypothetical protein
MRTPDFCFKRRLNASLAQLVRATVLYKEGRGFESLRGSLINILPIMALILQNIDYF